MKQKICKVVAIMAIIHGCVAIATAVGVIVAEINRFKS